MKKLIGFFGVLTFVACGGTEVIILERDVPTTPPELVTPPEKKTIDVSSPDADASALVDGGVDSSSEDATADAQDDAADAYVADASDPDARSPELDHPECECHQTLTQCKQAFPDLNIDCGALATCRDTPYFTIKIYGHQVGLRDVVGDPRQGCAVLGVGALCCSK